MKRIALFLLFLSVVQGANCQTGQPALKKYQGLLWEITGKGLKKPSYLFGTMHVSNKLAFHLADSFYTAIKNVDVVALETNPANWQDDYSMSAGFSKHNLFDEGNIMDNLFDFPAGYLHRNTFAIEGYENKIKHGLISEPSLINGMLYRTYENGADFEEDTYLDMYIFQTGSKLRKRVTGVENFQESERLVAEAYKDAAKERSNKIPAQDYNSEDHIKNPYTLEDAYRKGDLDMLDSIEVRQLGSKVFLEKFLYKRNEIQANSIDSIIKSKSSLFAAVGSAHLPGKRGVIEILRSKGYLLRPVKMGDLDGHQKDLIDKIRVPVLFTTVAANDSAYTVEIPGKRFYNFGKSKDLYSSQFADMGNGAYYLVSRVKTNSLLWGEGSERVYHKTDSLLYENIPGKIISKRVIYKNGFKGFDITNRTRRGDIQRYNIFITPFELLIFKIGGIGDYVLEGTEAKRFFSSISFKETASPGWLNYQPTTGGFSIKMPHLPILQKDNEKDRLEYTAFDNKENITYSLLKTSIHNYSFIEEDTFDLDLMQESFASSDLIEKEITRKKGSWRGYPVLDCNYKNKDGSFSMVRCLIQGPVYYMQVAHFKKASNNVNQYFDSFRILPFKYPPVKERRDTSMHFTVHSPLMPESKKQHDMMEDIRNLMENNNNEELIPEFNFRSIGNDTIGEKVLVLYMKATPFTYIKDSANIFLNKDYFPVVDKLLNNTGYIIKKDSGQVPGGVRFLALKATDTGSSRMILSKSFYYSGNFFTILSLTDTITSQSSLLSGFFKTFKPDVLLDGISPFGKKNKRFFVDFGSGDSATRARSLTRLISLEAELTDERALMNIIDTLSWRTRDYLHLKQAFISKLGEIKDDAVVVYFKQKYMAARDTADFQHTILKTLAAMQTRKSFQAFRDLIVAEPPVEQSERSAHYSDLLSSVRDVTGPFNKHASLRADEEGSWPLLYDSLLLAKELFPDILKLINLDEYKGHVMALLSTMMDSGYVDVKMYKSYFDKFYAEGRQELKKERAAERKKSISDADKANQSKGEEDIADKADERNTNSILHTYAILLIPFWSINPGVQAFFEDLLKLKNEQIRFTTLLLLLRHKRPVPDSLFSAFASSDQYRIELYRHLKEINELSHFPSIYNNQTDLVRSALVNRCFGNDNYDTVAYLDKLPVYYKNKKGVVYFFKYKDKRSDHSWKITSFGMQPENPLEFDDKNLEFTDYNLEYDLNEDILDELKPVKEQLEKRMKTMLIRKHSSSKEFYNNHGGYLSDHFRKSRYED